MNCSDGSLFDPVTTSVVCLAVSDLNVKLWFTNDLDMLLYDVIKGVAAFQK